MADGNKAESSKSHTIRWDSGVWEKVEAAARVLSYRQHIDLNPTDIIRAGASRFADEILAGSPELGIEAQEGPERASDAADAYRNISDRRRQEDRRIERAS